MADTQRHEAEVWLRMVEAALHASTDRPGNRGREAVDSADEILRAYKQRYLK